MGRQSATTKKSARSSSSKREVEKNKAATTTPDDKIATRKRKNISEKSPTSTSPVKKMTKTSAKEVAVTPVKVKKGTQSEKISPAKTKRSEKNHQSPRKSVGQEEVEEADVEDLEDEKGKFKCKFCNQGFKRKYDMEKHCRKHTGDKPYKCGICAKQVN